jgi:fucose permease
VKIDTVVACSFFTGLFLAGSIDSFIINHYGVSLMLMAGAGIEAVFLTLELKKA